MPYISRRILVSPCPFVNLDLFKKGHYHLSCRLVDEQAEQLYTKISCVEIRDLFGPVLSDYSYPGAHIQDGERFLTQTVLVEYTEQAFLLGECCVFQYDMPLRDYTDAYLPSKLTLHVDLMYNGDEEMPLVAAGFHKMASRAVVLDIDWRKGLHDHFPVIYDYFHMAAIGITVHATLHALCFEDMVIERPPLPAKRWPFQSRTQPTVPEFPDLAKILFGALPASANGENAGGKATTSESRKSRYEVPFAGVQRAQDAYQMLCDLLRSARDSLYISHDIMSGERTRTQPSPDTCDLTQTGSREEAEAVCMRELTKLNTNLSSAWDWFCASAVVHPEMLQYLISKTHSLKLAFMKETVISHEHSDFRSISNITDPVCQAVVSAKLRRTLHIPYFLYCRENVESQTTCSVLFIEPCPWETLDEGAAPPLPRLRGSVTPPLPRRRGGGSPASPMKSIAAGEYSFLKNLSPFFLNILPQSDRRRERGIHLVICVHGLQGSQFDLRLYRVYLQLALPHLRLEFLMAQSNQSDTFCDFNYMTDRIIHEIQDFIEDMPTPPSKISFIGHSLGNIVVRSVVSRPEFARYQPKLHLFLSICGPHLGTKFQTGIVSMGMWAVRKWYSSKSLLQLSLKDASDPRDAFLYHLSESPSFEYFRHVVLLSSPQDKYVPYHSAKIATGSDSSLQDTLSLEMIQNIIDPLRQAKVNLVRVSVDHFIPTSANSVIGRAAHIAMLDNELFIEKFVTLHLSQYFIHP